MKKGLALLLVIGLFFTTSSISFSQQEDSIENMFTKISAGWSHVVAIKNDGTVWGWGLNSSGQLGSDRFAKPTCISGITDAKAVSAGGDFTTVLKDDGTVWACGSNKYGQLGFDPTKGIKSSEWVRCGDLTDIVAIASGKNHVIALKSDGTVWTWAETSLGNWVTGQEGIDTYLHL